MFIYNAYIYLPCINTQRRTTSPCDITHIISSSDLRTPRLYQGSADSCEGDCNSDIIRLLQPSQTIQYCNQSVLEIAPYLNIFVLSITILDLISRSTLVLFSLLLASYLDNLMGLRFYIFFSLPDLRLCDCTGPERGIFSIAIVDLIVRGALVVFSLLRASYFYKSTGTRVLHIWFLTRISSL